jgi:Smg protein
MNENVVDILIYLYENYMDSEQQSPSNQAELHDELIQAGFPEREIDRAFRWLDELASYQSSQDFRPYADPSFRVFTEQEIQRLDSDCRGLLLFLEQNSILDQASRELVIERAIALENIHFGVEELKWIVLMVLMNQPGQENAHAQMEDLIYNEQPLYLH